MAAVAAADITNVTPSPNGGPLNLGGLPVEIIRIASAARTAADTAAITTRWIKNIRAAFGNNVTTNASATSTNTLTATLQVTGTYAVDILILGAADA